MHAQWSVPVQMQIRYPDPMLASSSGTFLDAAAEAIAALPLPTGICFTAVSQQ